MKTIQTLYNLLGINRKIKDEAIRLLYLKDFWGVEQAVIGECEGKSQSYISRELLKARRSVPIQDILDNTGSLFYAEEIRYLQFLPREIIMDVPVLAFINNILGVEPNHPFYQHFDQSVNIRIAALSSIGIQNKHLMKLFEKNQPTISMIVQRNLEKSITLELKNRYEVNEGYRLLSQKREHKIIIARSIN